MHRLKKRGLVACIRKDGVPVLQVTAEGRRWMGDDDSPEKHWNRKWSGRWNVLMYDVPEKHRSYRSSLRYFLQKLRMGQLQRSVWVSARDIRPDFDDLAKAGGVRDYAHLFEMRTTLGESSVRVAEQAWDFEALQSLQGWFCRNCEQRLRDLSKTAPSAAALTGLYRQARAAYLAVMKNDPWLPRALWPPGYRGEDAFHLHNRLIAEIARRLRS
jgi:phenylacetic acid degradation operon negative regulatory protein